MKGQVQTEYLFLIGVLVFISLALLYYGVQKIGESHKIASAEDAVNHIAEKVNELSSLTPGTRDTVWIEIPSTVIDMRLSGKYISLILLRGNDEQYILTKGTLADVLGAINLSVGLQQIFVTKVNDTAVKIGTDPLILEVIPSCLAVEQVLNENPGVSLLGADFQSTSQPYANNNLITPSTFINSGLITLASYDIYLAMGGITEPVALSLRTPPTLQSNGVCFHIHEAGVSCACGSAGGGGSE